MKNIYRFGYTFLFVGIICWSVVASLSQSQADTPNTGAPSKAPRNVSIKELVKNSELYLNTVTTKGRVFNIDQDKHIFMMADTDEVQVNPVMLSVFYKGPLPKENDIVIAEGKICYWTQNKSNPEIFFRALSVSAEK